jgi:hypothetical protein
VSDNAQTPAKGDNGTPSDNGDSAEGTAKQAPIMIPKARLDEEVQKRRAVEEQLNAVAESMLADVPEEYRDLIPNVSPAEKVKWLQAAKAKGLFSQSSETEKPKVPATDTKAPKSAPREEDVSKLPAHMRLVRAYSAGGKK